MMVRIIVINKQYFFSVGLSKYLVDKVFVFKVFNCGNFIIERILVIKVCENWIYYVYVISK